MSKFFKLGVYMIHDWSYFQIIFHAGFASQGVLNKDPTVWLDGRPLPISMIMNLTKSDVMKSVPTSFDL